MQITDGFTYIAFLMLLAGGLLALEKYTKWKIFNIVPPLVWLYVINMLLCTFNFYDMTAEGVKPTYSALKNNLLYAMMIVMLLRCDFRKLAKLGGTSCRDRVLPGAERGEQIPVFVKGKVSVHHTGNTYGFELYLIV